MTLEFLQDTPEFQDRYAETVIYRLFHGANPLGNGRLTRRELRRSDIVEALAEAEAREDINQVLRYFSYEHFYVIYCRFWELDTDHDFLIDKEDLMRYGGHALTCRAIERIFEQAPRPFNCREPGRMGYEDFVWFILAEENKADERSLEYWFRCADLDGNGALVEHELGWFYEEQLHRMECLGQEAVRFEDILTQLQDMVKPEVPGAITLKDVKRCGMGENFFNVLFNLSKFLNSESRDPFLIRQEREEPHLTAWDRFARAEYVRLSMEEEQADGGGGPWEPFTSPYGADDWTDNTKPNGPPANWMWIDDPAAAKPGEYSTEASLKRFLGIGNKTNYDVNTYPFGQMWQAKRQVPGNRTGLDVEVSINFFRIFSVDQKTGQADLAVWFRQKWFDPRLEWDPANWNGTDTLYVWMGKGGPDGEIWSPDMELYNAVGSIQDSLTKTYAVVKSNGEVKWSRPGRLKVLCNFQGLEK